MTAAGGAAEPAPPLFVLGVRRSGTTLLRVMLDRHSELAVPDESYFVPQLAHRHRGRVDPDAFLDDVRRLPTVREWGLTAADLAPRLRPGMSTGAAIAAIFEAYAARRGKRRWGDKTPLYMQHLRLLERLFPEARFVHLVRDGRDAAVSFLEMPPGLMAETWAQPRDAAGFACQWATEVRAARALGRRVGGRYLEVRYEELVEDPAGVLRRICAFGGLEFEPGMLEYVGAVDLSDKPHQRRLAQPPTRGVRNWRSDLPHADALAFEEVAGAVLHESGYELLDPAHGDGPTRRGRARLLSYRARLGAFNATAHALQRSPLWRRRHPPLADAQPGV